jgi:hypothetical protein
MLRFVGSRLCGALGFKKRESRNSKAFVARIDGEGGR